MDNKKTAEYYIHEDKNTGNIKLFINVNGNVKLKKHNSRDTSHALTYVLSASEFMDSVNLYSNTELSTNDIHSIINAKNIYYKKEYKEHPISFKDIFLKDNKDKSEDKHTYLSMNTFEYRNYNLLAISIKIKDFNKTSIKIIKENATEKVLILNYIKDIIPFQIDPINKDLPIIFSNKNKEIEDIFKTDNLNINIVNRIEKVAIEPFNEKEFIKNNLEQIDLLITNHINNLRIRDEVRVNYEEEKNYNKLVIYTDASTFIDSRKNINDSGCGIIIKHDTSDEIMFELNRKFQPTRDNFDPNVSEGNAILEALKFIKSNNVIDSKTSVEIRSDSISNIRKLNDLENHYKISKAIVDFCKRHLKNTDIEFKWVKGHSTYKFNVMADNLASSSIFNTDFDLKIKENIQAIEDFKKRNHSNLKMKR